jgi:NAD(P)-dependent dehydrogenase (short-subunit alcohol dehydrogenase family)
MSSRPERRSIGMTTTLLSGKNAIIYGAAGGLGRSVARTFAREGATVHLVGRTREPLEELAVEIGPAAHVAVLDASDQAAVDAHVADVVARHGSVDVSFNLINRGDVQQIPLVDMTPEQLLGATMTGLRSLFITSRAAARAMAQHGGGSILGLTSGSARGAAPGMGSTGPADAACDTYLRYLAAETGPQGIRVNTIHTAGVSGSLTAEKLAAVGGTPIDPAVIEQMISGMTMLKRAPDVAQIAETAAFLASDRAGAITGTVVNASCGLIAG